ncbi:MAG TPA: DUF177 domain-containing protein [Dissulfurispiraceae bacterium]|nr:DUF177 domain-containing protein [Dissulfurispiraceae bacterium]
MKIIISEIPEEGLELDLSDDIKSDDVRISSPVKSVLRLDKVGDDVMARGVLNGDVELQCSRCLNNFPLHISSQVNVVYHPVKELSKSEQHQLKDDELDTVFYSGDMFDTDDLLREQLLLNLPMKPLCSPDCKGFCPMCGADLSISTCNCKIKETDSRFEILKQLKKKE